MSTPAPERCVCGFYNRDQEHILRCINPAGYNTPRECDRTTPPPRDFTPVAGQGRLWRG
ncbi:hypothetical protein [Mycolicibacterium conceptionense]|uniref:hypothetical protein n=1 Tax=Mycolicibacterium conceptionense TaxID=451644 RepID=UPI000AC39B7B|nr:hypothetical protein [Mycolicibacterium conceptionense]